MTISGSDVQPTGVRKRVQGWCLPVTVPALAGLLAGCSTLESVNPVNWWHSAEGGKIAEQRPAPPGADAAYPNLANVPARPAPPDREAMRKVTEGLVADRQNAQYTTAAAPLADPSSATASPGLFGSRTLPPPAPPRPPAPGGVSATLSAASAPPAPAVTSDPPAPPSRAPVKPVASAPLAAPEPAAVAEPPVMSAAPPPRPAAAPAAAPVAAAPSGPIPVESNAMSLAFDPGSYSVLATTAAALKAVAANRQKQTIVLTGYGDASSSDPAVQATALNLALARAQAAADTLKAAGVPASAIRIGGEAAGRGVSLRLLQ